MPVNWSYLNWRQWRFLASLRDMDAAQALAHARTCALCTYELGEIGAGRLPSVKAATVTLTELMPAATA
jgi:hypothetical protein